MRRISLSLAIALGCICFAPRGHAAVEYVKQCSQIGGEILGPGYYYLPGTDFCFNPNTGDLLRAVTTADAVTHVWKTRVPYPRGQWTTNPAPSCQGNLVKLKDFVSTDFVLDSSARLRTAPVTLQLQATQMITGVIMQGGFYDPTPVPTGRTGTGVLPGGLCLRSIDSTVSEVQSGDAINPPFGNDGYAIGCISNEQIVNMPAAYAIAATSAYPSVDAYFVNDNNQPPVGGPYTYGKQLVITNDVTLGNIPSAITYCATPPCTGGTYQQGVGPIPPVGLAPMAGTLSVWVCVGSASSGSGNSQ